jgi:predicted ATPase/DNA-binding XRE family transcriptional regulator
MEDSGGSRQHSFGEQLAAYRTAAHLTQEELAARAGLSTDAISLLERGARTAPRISTVGRLAVALGLGPAERGGFTAASRRRSGEPALDVPPDLWTWSSTFVGRQRELSMVRALVARPDVRLLTLTGPPGAGKTRLALEAARGLGEGVVVVTLGPLGDPGLVVPAIREAMGLRAKRGEPALDTVAARCRQRAHLLVLDNFEHVLPAAAELVELLARCPELRLLVTSRASLRVRPEHELSVPPLPVPESVALLVERARAAAPAFRLTDGNSAPVAAVCARLDGLPLALELAAPWLRLLTPEELLERLDRRLELLVEGPRDLPERQRTLRAALEWSCQLLAPEPLALLRRLAVFAGGAPLDGLECVCEAAGPLTGGVLRHLSALADHSLVRRQDAAGGEPRVTMLESVREHARELLEAAGELDATACAHLEHYATLAERGHDEITGPGQEPWLARMRREHDNVRAALAWAIRSGDAAEGLRLAGAMWLFWDYDGHRHEGLEWLERLLALRSGSTPPAVQARALHAAGRLAEGVGSYDLSVACHEESLALYRELGDRRGAAAALRGLALPLGSQGRHDRAIPLLEEAVSELRELREPALLASALMNLGCSVTLQGTPGQATELYEEALALRRGVGDALGAALCLVNLSEIARAAGDLDRARACLEEAAGIARHMGSPYHLAASLTNLGELARMRGDVAETAARCRESLRLFAGIGERAGVAVCLRHLAWVAWSEGRLPAAVRLAGAAEALRPIAIAPDRAEAAEYERVCADLARRLGREAYAAAHEAGRRLSIEAAVAEAGREDVPSQEDTIHA